MEETQWKNHAIYVVQSMPTNTKTSLIFDTTLIFDKYAHATSVLKYALIIPYHPNKNCVARCVVICLVGFSSNTLFTPFFLFFFNCDPHYSYRSTLSLLQSLGSNKRGCPLGGGFNSSFRVEATCM